MQDSPGFSEIFAVADPHMQAKGMELLLNKAFKRLEPPGFCSNGRVKTCVAKALLICMAHARVVELGSVHIASIMQAVDPGEKGMVSCSRFSFLAASMIDAYYSSGEICRMLASSTGRA